MAWASANIRGPNFRQSLHEGSNPYARGSYKLKEAGVKNNRIPKCQSSLHEGWYPYGEAITSKRPRSNVSRPIQFKLNRARPNVKYRFKARNPRLGAHNLKKAEVKFGGQIRLLHPQNP